jgi:hypothetical protein
MYHSKFFIPALYAAHSHKLHNVCTTYSRKCPCVTPCSWPGGEGKVCPCSFVVLINLGVLLTLYRCEEAGVSPDFKLGAHSLPPQEMNGVWVGT